MKLQLKFKKLTMQKGRGETFAPAASHHTKKIRTPVQDTINLVLEDLGAKAEEPLESFALGMFDKEQFFEKWRTGAKSALDELETVLAAIYGFRDAVSALEDSIKEVADPAFELMDASLEAELNAISQVRILMLFVRHIFPDEDVETLREFMLRSEQGEVKKDKDKGSHSIGVQLRELFRLQNKSADELNDILKRAIPPAAVTVPRTKRKPTTPVNE